jgi:hypothetical protein
MYLKPSLLFTTFCFWLITSLLHLKFSLFLVQPLTTPWGIIKLKHYAPQAGYLVIFIMSLFLLWQLYKIITNKEKRSFLILLLWIYWFILVFLINKYLLATPLENIHFIQYGIISLLFIIAINTSKIPKEILIAKTLFWVSMAGIIDEIMQYTWITASYSQHLDFNDFILNLMGAIAGILFYLSLKHSAKLDVSKKVFNWKRLYHSWEIRLTIILFLSFLSLSFFDYIQLETTTLIKEGGFGQFNQHISFYFERAPELLGSWNNAFNGGKYYILSPIEGTLAFILIVASFFVVFEK